MADPIPPVPLRIDVVTPDRVEDRIDVEAAAFTGSSLTRELRLRRCGRWAPPVSLWLRLHTAAVATYRTAGMGSLGEVTDFRRP